MASSVEWLARYTNCRGSRVERHEDLYVPQGQPLKALHVGRGECDLAVVVEVGHR